MVERKYRNYVHLHVILEHISGTLDLDYVVDDQFAERCQKISSLVQLLNLLILIHAI